MWTREHDARDAERGKAHGDLYSPDSVQKEQVSQETMGRMSGLLNVHLMKNEENVEVEEEPVLPPVPPPVVRQHAFFVGGP